MAFTIKLDLPDFNNLKQQVPRALVRALNTCAVQGRRDVQQEMRRKFDRPTPYILNAVEFIKAGDVKKGNAEGVASSIVQIREGGDKKRPAVPRLRNILNPQLAGVPRHGKSFEGALLAKGLMDPGEFLVPTRNVGRDANGNIPVKVVNLIMAQLNLFPDGGRGIRSNATPEARQQFREDVRGDYFIPPKSGTNARSRLPRGIYFRDDRNRRLVMLFKFMRHRPSYTRAINMPAIVMGTVRREFWREFDRSIRMR